MKSKKRTMLFSQLLILCLTFSPVSSLQQSLQIAEEPAPAKLHFSDWTLGAATGITEDLYVGRLPNGVTVDADGSSISSPPSAKFSFTSDDGHNNDWKYRDVFASRGVSCTVPLVEGFVSDRSVYPQISLANALALQNEYGYEIGSHSYDHKRLTEYETMEEVVFQLTESKRSLTAMGLRISNFYIPFGNYTEAILDEAIKLYRAVRTSDLGVNTPLNKRHMKTYWIDEGTMALEEAKGIVDTARTNGQFVIFSFHSMVASRAYMDNMVGALIDYIQSFDDTQVLTVDRALDRIEQVLNPDTDYKIVNGNLVLDRFFLRSLPIGENVLHFAFSDGTTETATILIEKENRPRHRVAVISSTLDSGMNRLDSNEQIIICAALDTNLQGPRSSVASIGDTSVEGVLRDQVYTYTFRTNDMADGSYDHLVIRSNAGDRETVLELPIGLTIEKTLPPVHISSIEVATPPGKLVYHLGEPLDLTGMEVKVHYSDGTWQLLNDYSVIGGPETAGTHTITVQYGGFTDEFEITVLARTVTSIAITAPPGKLTYFQGETLSLSGMVVTATYSDGSTGVIENYTVSGYQSGQTGQQTVTVTYEARTATFLVTVLPVEVLELEITKMPTKVRYLEGEAPDWSGLVVTAYFTNGTEAAVTGYTLSGYSGTPGVKTITVTYGGRTTEFSVSVLSKQLTRIAVTKKPDKLVYEAGFDELDLTGMVITAYYNNGTSATVQNYYLGDYTNTPGTKTITVILGDCTDTFTITVKAPDSIPSSIASSVFFCNSQTKYLSKIPLQTSISTLLNGLTGKTYIKVYKGNTEVTGSALVGTGMQVRLTSGGTTIQTLTAVVTGDVNGDGRVTLTDYMQLKSHLLNKSTLTGSFIKAGDVNGDGKVTLTDYIQMKAYLLDKGSIQAQKY